MYRQILFFISADKTAVLGAAHIVRDVMAYSISHHVYALIQTGRTTSSTSQLQPVTTQRLILPAAPQVRPSVASSNIFKLEPQVATAGAAASAAAIAQPVTFIGQPGFAFQPIAKVCCDAADKTDEHISAVLCECCTL